MRKYRIKERYTENTFGYKTIRYYIQRRRFFLWFDTPFSYSKFIEAAHKVDMLRQGELFDEDD